MYTRKVDICVVSDVHLGTYGCHAKELLQYLRSIEVNTLVLNGDIFDAWSFSKNYFPKSHMQVIKQLLHMALNGTKVMYLTGNHDEVLRRYTDLQFDNFVLADYLILELNKEKIWIFHGDVFDYSTRGNAKILAKLGGKGYDLLIVLNRVINFFLLKMGGRKRSISKTIKNKMKNAIAFINKFESTIADLAIAKGYSTVICGHIHQPEIKTIESNGKKIKYMNSGDWVENLTALEYADNEWTLHHFLSEKKSESNIHALPKLEEQEQNIVEKILTPAYHAHTIRHTRHG